METKKLFETLLIDPGRLAKLGVSSLALFYSAARDEARPDSDVDFLVDFDDPATFDRYAPLKFYLEYFLNSRKEPTDGKRGISHCRPLTPKGNSA